MSSKFSLMKSVIAALALVSLLAGASFSADIVKDGKTLGSIVTASEPTEADVFAAEEVQVYLKKMTGAEVPIVKGAVLAGQPAIVVGSHPDCASASAELKAYSTDQEAFAVIGNANRLYLVGNGESAISYAAWEWLSTLGVRWLFPTVRGEYVPKTATVALQPIKKFDAPANTFRGPSYSMNPNYGHPEDSVELEHGVSTSALFSMRMRQTLGNPKFASDRTVFVGSGHSYMYYLPVSKYFKDHPEWFNLIDGKRQNDPKTWQVCFTNQEGAKEFAKNAMKGMQATIDLGVKVERMQVCVSPNDLEAWCECENCQKLVDKDGMATSMVTNFANMVAEEVHKTYPTAKVIFYAYDNYTKPPDVVKPAPMVCPELVFWTWNGSVGANHAKPMMTNANAKYLTYFKTWAEMSSHVSSHEYYGHYTWFTPWPKLTQMTNDIKEMRKEPKFIGQYSESHLHWGTQAPNFYLQPKLLWNPNADAAAVMDDFYKAAFGPAAPYIKEYYEILQAKMDQQTYIVGYTVEIPRVLTPDVIEKCEELIGSSAALLGDMDESMQWRTQLIIDGWKYSRLAAEAFSLYVSPSGNQAIDKKLIRDNLQMISDFADTDQGRWVYEKRIVHGAIDSVLNNFKIDLTNLPAGETKMNDSLQYGGAMKFNASKLTGLSHGMWGSSIAAYGKALVEIPVAAEKGHSIKSFKLKLAMGSANPAEIDAKVSVVKPDGSALVAASDAAAANKELDIPASAFGEGSALRLEFSNLTDSKKLVISRINIDATIE